MISNKYTCLVLGVLAPVSMVATPLLAKTPTASEILKVHSAGALSVDLEYPRFAQVGGSPIDEPTYEYDEPEPSDGPSESGPSIEFSEDQTALVVVQLQQIQSICAATEPAYRTDCFATLYRQLAEDIPENGDYTEIKEILETASRDLKKLSNANRDKDKPAVRATLTTDTGLAIKTPPINAVKAEVVQQLNLEASNILEEAETKLLRSASSDAKRAIHYQRIAAAVGSNKVLLRSA
jgi:hypothetical protein